MSCICLSGGAGGSFTAAAQRLGLAQSGISRSVRELEERLGVRLLVRTTRKLSLTHAGEQLYQTAGSAFDALDTGLTRLAHYRQTPSGTVRINASQHAIENACCQSSLSSNSVTRISVWN